MEKCFSVGPVTEQRTECLLLGCLGEAHDHLHCERLTGLCVGSFYKFLVINKKVKTKLIWRKG